MEVIGAIQPQEIKAKGSVVPLAAPGQHSPPDNATLESNLSPAGLKQNPNEVDREKIQQAAKMLKDYIQSSQTRLKIQVHPGTGAIAVKVVSEKDGSVIREIPPEELLNLAAKIKKMMGLLFDRKV